MCKEKIIRHIVSRETDKPVGILKGKEAMDAIDRYLDMETAYQESLCGASISLEDLPDAPSMEVLGLYEFRSEEYYALVYPKDIEFDASIFLFVSEFIPFIPEVWASGGKPSIQKMYIDEISMAGNEGCRLSKAPLFVTGSYESGMMPAYDLQDKELVVVEGYKTYRKSFTIHYSEERSEMDKGKYFVYIPSEEFRLLTGISCSPTLFERKGAWEEWEKRPFHIPDGDIPKLISDHGLDMKIYQEALNLLNSSYREDKGYPMMYSKLEQRLLRFERLLHLGSPDRMLVREQALIKKALGELT